jgi:hypothetical protein
MHSSGKSDFHQGEEQNGDHEVRGFEELVL